jgi:cysteine desulfurase
LNLERQTRNLEREMTVKLPIYMDNNATTPVDPRVLEAMLPTFTTTFGNAASRNHGFGWAAEALVDHARHQAAQLLGADPREIIWTSGATESNNLAIKGVAGMYRDKGRHIVTAAHEHKAVLDPCKRLRHDGFEVTFLQPGPDGVIRAEQVREAIRPDTILVTIMWANNEIGTLNEVPAIGRVCKDQGVLFHTDATQYLGKLPVNVEADGIDLLSASAHKLYGPKGAGFLYVRRKGPRVRLTPLFDGGGHERGMRSGTLNVPGIVGCGAACHVAQQEMPAEAPRLRALRDRLENAITSRLEGATINGSRTQRIPHTSNISFAWIEGESLMMAIKDIAVSSGSACTSASLEPSHVLRAIGVGDDLAHSSIRFGLGRFNTEEEVGYVADQIVAGVNRLREMSPLYEMFKDGIDPGKVQWASS